MKKSALMLIALIFMSLLLPPNMVKADDFGRPVLHFSVPGGYTNAMDKVLQHALKNMGYDLAIRTQVMTSALEMANSCEVDGIIVRGPGAEQSYKNLVMVPTPILTWSFNTFSREDKEFTVKSWEDLAGLRIGMMYQRIYVDAHLPANIKSITKKDNIVQLYEALQNDEVDIVVVSALPTDDFLLPQNVKFLSTIDSSPAYAYMNKNKAFVVPQLAAEIQKMNDTGVTKDLLEDGKLETEQDELYILNLTSSPYDSVNNIDFLKGLQSVISEDARINTISLFSEFTINDRIRKNQIADFIRSELLEITPDVITISDEEALNFVKDYYAVLFQKIPVIFCGVQDFDMKKIDGFENYFYGFADELSVTDTFSLMLKLYPSTKNVFVINDDSQLGMSSKEKILQELSDFTPKIDNYIYNASTDQEGLLKEINSLGNDTLVLVGHSKLDATFFNSCKYPAFDLSGNIGNGQVGGKYLDYQDMGVMVGNRFSDLTNNTLQEKVSIDTAKHNTWTFDHAVFETRGVNARLLPENSKIMNEPVAPRKLRLGEMVSFVTAILTAIITFIYLFFFLRKLNVRNRELRETLEKLHTAEEMLQKDKEIDESRKRLEIILESAPVHFMVCTVDGIFLRLNKRASETFAANQGESILSLFQTLGEGQKLIQKVHAESFVFGEILHLKTKERGTRRYYTNISNTADVKNNEMYVWLIDIEESETKKDLIDTAHKDLSFVLQSFPFALTIVDHDEKREFINDEYIKFFGFDSANEALEYDVDKLDAPLQDEGASSDVQRKNNEELIMDTDEILTFPWVFLSKASQNIEALVYSRTIMFHGNRRSLRVLRDISEEKNKAEQLEKLAEAEKNANALKNMFLITMSHEIRTPMNAILGLSEIELRKEHGREVLDVLRKINTSAKNLLAIIGDILDFAKIEAEELIILEEETELEEVVANALLLASQRIGSKNISLFLHMDKNLPNIVLTDKTRLWQILKNLLDNSAKYTQTGSISLDVALVESTFASKLIRFTVTDTGLGMSEEQLSRLFTPFEQFHSSLTGASGTGLGMTITKQIIEHMNGEFEINSEVNAGTTIKVELPLKVPRVTKTIREALSSLPLSGYNILVADDDPLLIEIMRDLLESAGVSPVTASSGEEALELYKKKMDLGKPFDIVILDYIMGGMNGIEVAKKIMAISDHRIAKLLMVTAYTKQLLGSDIENAGYEDIIEKPFTPTYFMKRLVEIADSTVEFNNFDGIVFTGASVLICEDNFINQEVAMGVLEFFGIEPDIAGNGQEGLDMLEKKHYDLVFMDILMPVMDGHAATQAIRASDKSYKDIPIVAMTANVMADEIEKCINEGMNGHVGKPISFEKVFAKLSEFLPKHLVSKTVSAMVEKSSSDTIKEIIGSGYKDALARLVNNEEKYFKLLKSFAGTIESYLLPTSEAFAVENISQNKVNVHTLKGVAGNLGIYGLQEKALHFEKASDDEKQRSYEDLCDFAFKLAEGVLANLPEAGGKQ